MEQTTQPLRVVVTGGAGFIGANLCRRLSADDRFGAIAAYDNLTTGFAHNLTGADVELIEADIRDAGALDRAFAGADAVVHLAARGSVSRSVADPLATHAVNIAGTVEVMEAVRRAGVAHVLFASSSSVYGSNPVLPKNEQLEAQPMSPYAVSKLAGEQWVLCYGKVYGLSTLAFRFFNVFGPLQTSGHVYAAAIPQFISSAIAGEPIRIFGDGLQSRDFTYIDTVTGVIMDALVNKTSHSGPVNLALGGRIDLNAIISMLRELLDAPLVVEHLDPRPGDVRHSQADPARLLELFPDVPVIDLADGLQRTLDWYRDVGHTLDLRAKADI